MNGLTRRQMLAALAAGGGALGLAYTLRGVFGMPPHSTPAARLPADVGMAGHGMMMNGPPMDMRSYMDMFMRHGELRRTVEEIPGGVRTTTESDAPDLVTRLQAHVSAMYSNLDQGSEVMCMSATLPTLFQRAGDYRREITLIPKGVVAVETSSDPNLIRVIREHAVEVTGFVNEGMPAMMGPGGGMGPGGMGPGGMMGPR